MRRTDEARGHMRLEHPARGWISALAAILAVVGVAAAQVRAADDDVAAPLPHGDRADPTVAVAEGDDGAPGLAEVAETALADVLEAARRDSAGWARSAGAWMDAVLLAVEDASFAFFRDPAG